MTIYLKRVEFIHKPTLTLLLQVDNTFPELAKRHARAIRGGRAGRAEEFDSENWVKTPIPVGGIQEGNIHAFPSTYFL
jgi:hypothetical protein